MSVDNGVGVAVMSAQKMPAAKMGHTPCYQNNGKHGFKDRVAHVQLGQDINKTGSNAAPHRNHRACFLHLWRIIR
jgi:hypothetical protein